MDISVNLTCTLPSGRNDSTFPQVNLIKSIIINAIKENDKYTVKENIREHLKIWLLFIFYVKTSDT